MVPKIRYVLMQVCIVRSKQGLGNEMAFLLYRNWRDSKTAPQTANVSLWFQAVLPTGI